MALGTDLGLGLDIVGLGLQLFEGNKQAQINKQEAGVSQEIVGNEQSINQQKLLQTQMEGRRSTLQNFRNAQRLRAQATAAAVNQGSSAGAGLQSSGLQGGLSSITDQATFNAQGIANSQQIAQNIFGFQANISSEKQQLAGLQGQAATAQGYSSLGGSLLSSGGTIGKFAQDLFKV